MVTVGIPFLFSERIADLGRDKEPGLWESWGGPPTTRFLRHRNEKIDAGSKRRIHTSLATLCPDHPLPSVEREAQDPSAADAVYATVMHVPRTMARDASAEYPLVLAANTRYGFRRNLWAFRAQGIVLGRFLGKATNA